MLSPPEDERPSGSSLSGSGCGSDDEEDDSADEEVARMMSLLEAARVRRDAREARQKATLAKLNEISAKMRERELVRHRWLPSWLALPLSRWFAGSGYVNSPAEAVLTSLGLLVLVAGLALGYYYQRG